MLVLALFVAATSMAQEGVTMKRSNTLRVAEVPPTWPGCTGSISQKNNCLRQKLATHVVKNFKFPKDYKKGKVILDMTINKEGNPVVNSVTGGTKSMQDEVRRVAMTMPKVKPGHMGGTKKDSKLKLAFTL